jgi:phosphoglucomutase
LPFAHAWCRIQSLFNALGEEAVGKSIGLGGDGRYFNKQAVQVGGRAARVGRG